MGLMHKSFQPSQEPFMVSTVYTYHIKTITELKMASLHGEGIVHTFSPTIDYTSHMIHIAVFSWAEVTTGSTL